MYLNSELCLVRSLQPLAQPRQLEVNVPHAGRVLADVVHKAALKAHADVVLEKVAEAPGLLALLDQEVAVEGALVTQAAVPVRISGAHQ